MLAVHNPRQSRSQAIKLSLILRSLALLFLGLLPLPLSAAKKRNAAAGSFVTPPKYWVKPLPQKTRLSSHGSCPSLQQLSSHDRPTSIDAKAERRRRRQRRRTPNGEKSPSARNLMVSSSSRRNLMSACCNDISSGSNHSLGRRRMTRNDSTLFATASRITRRGSMPTAVCTTHQG